MPLVNITEGWQKILPSSVLKQRCKDRARTLQHEVSFAAMKMAWGKFYPRGSSLPGTSVIVLSQQACLNRCYGQTEITRSHSTWPHTG
jgi:hypothetical protein